MLGTLLGTGDIIPTFKEIIGFGQKVEQNAPSTFVLIHRVIEDGIYNSECLQRTKDTVKGKFPYPGFLPIFCAGQRSRGSFVHFSPCPRMALRQTKGLRAEV